MCRDFAFVLYFEIFFASRVRGNGTIAREIAFVPYTGHPQAETYTQCVLWFSGVGTMC